MCTSFFFVFFSFLFSCPATHRDLPSFPTRRSSDLRLQRLTQRRLPRRPLPSPPRNLRRRPTRSRPDGCRRSPACLAGRGDRKSTRLNSSHLGISYAVFCLKKKTKKKTNNQKRQITQ